MFQATAVGYLGADAITKNENGREFTTCRIAHTDRWNDSNGQPHESTIWIDVIISGRPNVVPFLTKGTLIYVSGHAKLRCYSSEKARGFVAGITISPVTIELLGGQSDIVPKRLYTHDGRQVDVTKYYYANAVGQVLTNGRGREFAVDDNGWVVPMEQVPTDVQPAAQQTNEANGQATMQASEQHVADKS